jgi:hypothetical protein
MMGRQTADQGALFYEFRLEERVPEQHLLRRINAVIAPVFARNVPLRHVEAEISLRRH